MLHQHLLFLCQLETTVKQTWLLMLKTNFSLILFKPSETQPVHRRCFIFLFVLLENIGVYESEASTRARSARKKKKNVYFLLPPQQNWAKRFQVQSTRFWIGMRFPRGLFYITRARRTLKRKQRVCEQAIGNRDN